MVLYVLLTILTCIIIMIALGAFGLFVLSGCEAKPLLIAVVATVITIALSFGINAIEKANTTVKVETMQMEVTKYDATDEGFYITVDNQYVVRVSEKEYAKLTCGDMVKVVIETKTVFNKTTETTSIEMEM